MKLRMTKEQFYQVTDPILRSRAKNAQNNLLASMPTGWGKKDLEDRLKKLLPIVGFDLDNPLTDQSRKLMARVATYDQTDWEASLEPQSLEWIIQRALMNQNYDETFMCYAYVSRYSKLPNDLLKELIFINSGLFDFSYWTDEIVDLICGLFAKYRDKKDCYKEIVSLSERTDLPEAFVLKCKEEISKAIKEHEGGIYRRENQISRHIFDSKLFVSGGEKILDKVNLVQDYIDELNLKKDKSHKYYLTKAESIFSKFDYDPESEKGTVNYLIHAMWEEMLKELKGMKKKESQCYLYILEIPSKMKITASKLKERSERLDTVISKEKIQLEKYRLQKPVFFLGDRLDWNAITGKETPVETD